MKCKHEIESELRVMLMAKKIAQDKGYTDVAETFDGRAKVLEWVLDEDGAEQCPTKQSS